MRLGYTDTFPTSLDVTLEDIQPGYTHDSRRATFLSTHLSKRPSSLGKMRTLSLLCILRVPVRPSLCVVTQGQSGETRGLNRHPQISSITLWCNAHVRTRQGAGKRSNLGSGDLAGTTYM
jgi:hypothetical protein